MTRRIGNTRVVVLIQIPMFLLVLVMVGPISALDDDVEENDSRSRAQEVTPGVYTGLVFDGNDHDWYKVGIARGDDLTVIIHICDYEMERRVTLEDEDGMIIDSTTEIINGGMTVHAVGVSYSGFCYINAFADDTINYRMSIHLSLVYPGDDIFIAQGVQDLDNDLLLNDGVFFAGTRYSEISGVRITVYDSHGNEEVDSGLTRENGEYDSFNLPDDTYHWKAEYHGSIVGEGEFDVSTGDTGRNIHAFVGMIGDDCYYDQLNIWAYDKDGIGVADEVITLSHASNNSRFFEGTTDDEGNFLMENLQDGEYIITISHNEDRYLTCQFRLSSYKPMDTSNDSREESERFLPGFNTISVLMSCTILFISKRRFDTGRDDQVG